MQAEILAISGPLEHFENVWSRFEVSPFRASAICFTVDDLSKMFPTVFDLSRHPAGKPCLPEIVLNLALAGGTVSCDVGKGMRRDAAQASYLYSCRENFFLLSSLCHSQIPTTWRTIPSLPRRSPRRTLSSSRPLQAKACLQTRTTMASAPLLYGISPEALKAGISSNMSTVRFDQECAPSSRRSR